MRCPGPWAGEHVTIRSPEPAHRCREVFRSVEGGAGAVRRGRLGRGPSRRRAGRRGRPPAGSGARLPEGLEALSRLHALMAEHLPEDWADLWRSLVVRWRRLEEMAVTRPVLLAVDDEPVAAALVEQELGKRYGADYRVVCERSPQAALLALEEARARGEHVAVVLADLSMPGMSGPEFLCRAHELHPGASRVVMFDWTDRRAAGPMLRAWTLGQVDDWITKPVEAADEHFHQGVSAFLYGWAQRHRPGVEMVQVVGRLWSARSHEVRDLLSRNSVRYGFHEPDSAEGRALLDRVPPDRHHADGVALP